MPDFLFIQTGSYIYVNGVKYIILSQNKITLIHERMYEYIVVFESGAALLSNVRVRNLSDHTLFFPYTASAEDHLSLIVSNLNRAYIGYNWSVGECDVDNIEKYLQYNYVDCLSALNALADIFNTEWEITNNVISLHKVEYNTDDPVELSYGIGNGARSEIARNTSSMAMTSVFTQGGSRNIDASKYGSSVLLLPKSVTFRFDGCKFEDEDGFAENKSRSYTTDSRGTIITSTKNLGKQINEGVIDCSDIYPEESHYVVDFEYRSSQLFWLTLDIPENVDKTLEYISSAACGDVRRALGALELCYGAAGNDMTPDTAGECISGYSLKMDRDGDEHYDLVSAFQKSIRGSDENAAVFYLAKMLEAGDLLSPIRRLLVIASEDIGLAYPMAAVIVKACCDNAMQLGLPEGRLPLAEAVIFLATLPKSNSAYMAYAAAARDIHSGLGMSMPNYIRDSYQPSAEKNRLYKYPHDYPQHYCPQQYLPDDIKDRVYYNYGDNKTENAAKEYWAKIKKLPNN